MRFVAADRRLGWTGMDWDGLGRTGTDWPGRELRGNLTSAAGQAVSQTPRTKLGSQATLNSEARGVYFENGFG